MASDQVEKKTAAKPKPAAKAAPAPVPDSAIEALDANGQTPPTAPPEDTKPAARPKIGGSGPVIHYIGVKHIVAEPVDKDGQPGYKVVYDDGYTSWSPKDIFENAYLPIPAGVTVQHGVPDEISLTAAAAFRERHPHLFPRLTINKPTTDEEWKNTRAHFAINAVLRWALDSLHPKAG